MLIILLVGVAFTALAIAVYLHEQKANKKADESKEVTATLVKHLNSYEYAQYVAQKTNIGFLKNIAENVPEENGFNDDMAAEWYSVYEYEINDELRSYVSNLPTAEPVGSTTKLAVTTEGDVIETTETRKNQSGVTVLLIIGLSLIFGVLLVDALKAIIGSRIEGSSQIAIALISAMTAGLLSGAITVFVKIKASEEVEATVTDIHIEESTDSDGNYTRSSFPVYTYYHNGKTHTKKSTTSSSKMQVGDKHIIYVYKDGQIYEKRTAVLLLICAAFTGVMMCVFLFA